MCFPWTIDQNDQEVAYEGADFVRQLQGVIVDVLMFPEWFPVTIRGRQSMLYRYYPENLKALGTREGQVIGPHSMDVG